MNKRVEYHRSKLVTDKIDVEIADFEFEEPEKPQGTGYIYISRR